MTHFSLETAIVSKHVCYIFFHIEYCISMICKGRCFLSFIVRVECRLRLPQPLITFVAPGSAEFVSYLSLFFFASFSSFFLFTLFFFASFSSFFLFTLFVFHNSLLSFGSPFSFCIFLLFLLICLGLFASFLLFLLILFFLYLLSSLHICTITLTNPHPRIAIWGAILRKSVIRIAHLNHACSFRCVCASWRVYN